MSGRTIRTPQEARDLLRGLTILGTGGGGRPELGEKYVLPHLESGKSISWRDPVDVPDDAWVCSTFNMGSLAPRTGTPTNIPPGYEERRVAQPLVRALNELEQYLGIKVDALVASEAGAGNTGGPIDVATRLGLMVVDGDYSGRAVPEATQSTTSLYGVNFWPAAICDEWGNVVLIKEASAIEVAEALGKMVSVVTKATDAFAICSFAAFLCRGRKMKEIIVPGTLTRALAIGAAIREAREERGDPVAAAAQALGGWVLFTGQVVKKEWENRGGYMYGTTTLEGDGKYAGRSFKVWFQNENHISWLDGKTYVTSPDLISIIRAPDGEPTINTFLAEGDRVAVLGAPYPQNRTPEVLHVLGPRHFGFDLEYTPIENVVR